MTTQHFPVLELRVHGVHGTPAYDMLGVGDAGDVQRVRGDASSAFYEARRPAETSGPPLPGWATREAYHWGELTQGTGALQALQRAGWLTLMPFALVNLAMWSVPGLGPNGRNRRLSAALIRLAGLLLTTLLVLATCGVALDLLAGQCFRGGVPRCSHIPSRVELFVLDKVGPGPRLAIGQLAPAGLLLVVWLLSWISRRRYEEIESPASGGATSTVLSRDGLWRGRGRTRSLADAHVAVGLAVTAGYTALPLCRQAPEHRALYWVLLAVAGVVLAGSTVISMAGVRDDHDLEGRVHDWEVHGARTLLYTSMALVAAEGTLLCNTNLTVVQDERLRGVGAYPAAVVVALYAVVILLVGLSRSLWSVVLAAVPIGIVIVVAVVYSHPGHAERFWTVAGLLLVCGLIGILLHKGAARPEQAWGGSAPAMLLGAAVGVAVLFSSGVTMVVADQLNGAPRVSALETAQVSDLVGSPRARLDADAHLADGWVDLRVPDHPVLRRGLLTTASLTSQSRTPSGDVVSPSVYDRVLGSRVLRPGQLLDLPGGTLTLDNACLSKGSHSVRRVPGVTLALSSITVGSPGKKPGGCDPLAGQVRVVTTHTPSKLVVPLPYVWFATLLPPLILLGAVLVWGLLRRRRTKVGPALDALAGTELATVPTALLKRCCKARRSAALVHRAERLVEVLTLGMLAIAIFIVAGLLVRSPPRDVEAKLGALTTIGLYASAGAATLLIALGSRLRTGAGLRKHVGVLWDLTTFFPRTGHPLAPPCYAERVVPQVVCRLREGLAAQQHTGRVVLSGHSQGSTISAAALLQLSPGQLTRVRFVTYGTQLRPWFGRIFPGLFGPDALGNVPTTGTPDFASAAPDAPVSTTPTVLPVPAQPTLMSRLGPGHWRSLYRRTDPLGFRVLADTDAGNPVDVHVAEVHLQPVDALQTVQGHGDYPATPEYAAVVRPWLD